MRIGYIDAHCHLFFIKSIDDIIKRCKEKGLILAIETGINPETNRKVLEEVRRYNILRASLGFHPTDIAKSDEKIIEEEIEFIRNNSDKILAIGEVGLDYYWIKENDLREKQKRFLYKFIELAEKLDKPIIIHSRNAEKDCLEILSTSNTTVILHSFLNKEYFKKALELDFYLSIPAVIYKDKRFKFLAEAPLDRILTETDSPFLDPTGFRRNEPWKVLYCIKAIAKENRMREEEVEEIIVKNFKKIFKMMNLPSAEK